MTPKKPLTPENALARAAALCSRSEHAEYDIRRKLNEWGITFASANDIIYRLISEKYIEEFWTDAKGLNFRAADIHPKATENIDKIIDFGRRQGYSIEPIK